MFPLLFCYNFLSKFMSPNVSSCYFVVHSCLNLCCFPSFRCCFGYNFLSEQMCYFSCAVISKSMHFRCFFVIFGIPSYVNLCCSRVSFHIVAIPSYLNLCLSPRFLCYFAIPSYLNLCIFQCFLCCFCYTFLSQSMLFRRFLCYFCCTFLSKSMLSQCFLCFLLYLSI